MDLTKILKYAPRGLKLYSTVHGEVELERINNSEYPIVTFKSGLKQVFTRDGRIGFFFDGECVLFPSKDQRDWSKFTAPWYKQEKFDPTTLRPFDKVLVRDSQGAEWRCDIFSHIDNNDKYYPYFTISLRYTLFCIPYNEDTKHLIGTTDEAPEFYNYQED